MNRSVCIVDDDRQIVALATKVAETAGYEVAGFTDPFAARAHIEQNRVDLVIVDLIMPEMDGYQLTEWVREYNPYLRVINMTGYAPVLTLLACWRIGADACVLKGPEFAALLRDAIEMSFAALEQWEKSVATVRASSKKQESEQA